ncbi:hypothetical protein EJB05_09527, partial [Eragrostis curvula]
MLHNNDANRATEVLVGCSNVSMLVSIIAAGWAGDMLGRRATLVVASALLMAGGHATALGGSYASALLMADARRQLRTPRSWPLASSPLTSLGSGFARLQRRDMSASSRGVLSTLLGTN